MGTNNYTLKELSDFHRQNQQKFVDLDTKVTKMSQQLDEQATNMQTHQEKTNDKFKLLSSQIAELIQAYRSTPHHNGNPGILSSPSPTHEGDFTNPIGVVSQSSHFHVFNDAENKGENSIPVVVNEEDEFLDMELIPPFFLDESEDDDDSLNGVSLEFEEV
ncbi:hypothetical protein MKW98_018655 [Papaver atlanticum]|uniref:Uncharacterized protein n=1 Tax=Papaver atlanticum TaxID=357466 RepID=A0AAD4XNP2_9MAGN|nr:hypothetical protein MKW98_018655 [Papaver atlanticum]